MSPVVSSSTSSEDPHEMSDRPPLVNHSVGSSSVQHGRNQKQAEVLRPLDENRPDGGRSSPVVLRKPTRPDVRLFKENSEGRTEQESLGCDRLLLRSSKRIEIASRYMEPKRRPDMPSSAKNSSKVVVVVAAADSVPHTISGDSIGNDTTSPNLLQECRTTRPRRTLITVPSRYLGDRTGSRGISCSFTKTFASPSLGSNRNNLPPHLPGTKAVGDAKLSQQESIHSLRLLHNRYLQWRFSNAMSEASMVRQTQKVEKMLYSHSIKISELRESVTRKRAELELVRRSMILSSILEAQIRDLDHWCTLESDFVTSMSETINALLNVSSLLPTSGDIECDVRDFAEALKSALEIMDMIESHISSYIPKAAEMGKLVSELARVNWAERNYIDEIGEVLSRMHMLQVGECSLIAQLIQLQQRRPG